jgi:bifunctional DNA-binding transcriptional regulator/antitoxin component of YhaV-PrlF toxin-antitoxin module
MTKIAIPYDIYNKEGDMVEIEYRDQNGDFIVVALWDESDAQTSENRIEFRKWAKQMVKRLGYEVYE